MCSTTPGPFYVCSWARTQVFLFVRQILSPLSWSHSFFFFFNTYNVYSIRYFRKTYLASWVMTTCFLVFTYFLLPPQHPCTIKMGSPLPRNEQCGLNLSHLTKTTPESGFECKSEPKVHGLRDTLLIGEAKLETNQWKPKID